jgi:predicted DNA-binding WGR domain protein
MIKLTRSDPAKNMHRFYALQLAATLVRRMDGGS